MGARWDSSLGSSADKVVSRPSPHSLPRRTTSDCDRNEPLREPLPTAFRTSADRFHRKVANARTEHRKYGLSGDPQDNASSMGQDVSLIQCQSVPSRSIISTDARPIPSPVNKKCVTDDTIIKAVAKIGNVTYIAFQHISHCSWKCPISASVLSHSSEDAGHPSKTQKHSQPVSVVSNARARIVGPSPPSPMDTLPPLERAAFSTTVRLLSCTVTESMTRAIYIPVAPLGVDARALAVILSSDASNKPPAVIATYKLEDILAILPLKHAPIFKHDTPNPYALEIGLLDPMDICPHIFVVDSREMGTDKACPQASLVAHLLTLVH